MGGTNGGERMQDNVRTVPIAGLLLSVSLGLCEEWAADDDVSLGRENGLKARDRETGSEEGVDRRADWQRGLVSHANGEARQGPGRAKRRDEAARRCPGGSEPGSCRRCSLSLTVPASLAVDVDVVVVVVDSCGCENVAMPCCFVPPVGSSFLDSLTFPHYPSSFCTTG